MRTSSVGMLGELDRAGVGSLEGGEGQGVREADQRGRGALDPL
jgi:hypothetical protein